MSSMVWSTSDILSLGIRLMLRVSKREGEIWDQDKKEWGLGSDIRNKPGTVLPQMTGLSWLESGLGLTIPHSRPNPLT